MYTLNENDLQALNQIIRNHGLVGFYHSLSPYIDQCKNNKTLPFIQIYPFSNRYLLSLSSLQNDFNDYLITHKGYSLGEAFGYKLAKDYPWNSDVMEAYAKLIKDGKYYPAQHQEIADIINHQNCESTKVFQIMYKLAALCKDDLIAANSMAACIITKRKPSDILLLEQEKFHRAWMKRFKGIDIETIAPDATQKVNSLFLNLKQNSSNDFIKKIEGHFIRLTIDANLLSQNNKFSVNKNIDAVTSIADNFENFTRASKEPFNIFSITGFTSSQPEKTNHVVMEFYYADLTQKERINSLACDLIDYALKKIDKNTFQGSAFRRHDNKIQFFTSYLMNYSLEASLPQKTETVPIKKNKI